MEDTKWIIRPAKVPNDNPPEHYERTITGKHINNLCTRLISLQAHGKDVTAAQLFEELWASLRR